MQKKQVAEMFDNIAPRYDFLNHFLSLGIDKLWRKRLVKLLNKGQVTNVLDVATGTGDLAISIAKSGKKQIIGIDISEQMLEIGKKKVAERKMDCIRLKYGDSENLEFESNQFDAVTVAFGVRNFENLEKGLSEMFRVLETNGRVFILEFSMPENSFIRALYRFYFLKILPFIGRAFSKHSNAYTYLPESVEGFPKNMEMLRIMQKIGFRETHFYPLTFGIAAIYCGKK